MVDVLEHQVRYQMPWGHKITGQNGDVDVNRSDYNAAFGVETPDTPDIPDAIAHVWGWWQEINARRPPGYDSMPPLTYSEIHSWSALTRTQVSPSEIGIIIQLDDAYLKAVHTERTGQRERNKET